MRIARWGAAAGAVLLVSLPIAAQADVLPTPVSQPSTPTAPAPSTSPTTAAPAPAPASAPAPAPAVSHPSSSVNTSAPSHPAPVVRPAVGTGVKSTVSRHLGTKSSNVKTSSTHHSVRAGRVHTADTTQTIPAPGALAEAYALNILNAIAISHTKASASGSGTSATANVLELGGNPPASAFGGTVSNGASGNGDVFDTTKLMIPANQLYLAIAPWSATTSSNSASAIADLLVLTLGDPQANPSQSVTVKVLQSTSNANYTPGQSTSNATSDGAYVNAGGPSGLTIDLLHSETSSSAPGSSYVLSINGNEILNNSQVGGQCTLSIPSLLQLNCVTATGGPGSSVAKDVELILGPGPSGPNLPICLSCSSQQTNNGAPPVASGGSGAQTGPAPAPAPAPHATVHSAVAAGHHALPFTGIDLPVLLGIAILLLTGGLGLVWVVRRPRAAGLV
jgi:hypothetical protein